ncbi:ketohydroxyglutarate aldolase [Aneurinibacillus migulanus]|uniref:2-dehydro-3-deoxyphosphogluconate aldolase / (4S)-4-hydroxy-2-oxoglutarate aldolase n=1 Tax=Aneurinibacillus migulanus TaxID=47500 RepID=A0A0D1XW48_ANEMI|nr:bifunctional 2-keto-4-hydroxyglutarate aldolase/2-keto-3-deoxy-6-phosphogluconate aldolase [Aneurinibacillus migulanus]KIV56363.1 ketohydroxyglutarate aldolase [Aneurinibacillus migulanus]KIV58177.1 ketohydroxyglutarate aldolase [Aneurinibacillus migulanus]KON96949.1 ketohydroxyglutarate aldolase [Aneurinibacillus migulanus]KPD07077.1 ketohydroxyglutarate aldolase [Aneurinibacillus migulanus]MED0896249.1 bifunctional 2-keto-4-hydroxyglutarate aldolase/2-keto-3-deoxy-6-phosphogluconate aldol
MNNKYTVLQKLTESKVVAVIRGENAEEAIQLSKAAVEGGIQAIEITYTTPNATDVFHALEQSNALLGAGSVLDPETARHALLAGAQFIVSPHFNKEIAILCNRYSVPYLPGCMTINEMVKALESGCDVLKLFPANNFEPSFIRSINGPLPNVQIMPTGGIHLGNMKEWIQAGAVAVGIGSDLNKAYRKGGYEAVVTLSQTYMQKSVE